MKLFGETENGDAMRLRDKLRDSGILFSGRELLSFLIARLREIRLSETASGMALASLLGIVPVLAISLAVFAAFPSFSSEREALESLILTSFIPEQYSEVIVAHLREFSSHAAGLTTFGIVGLVITGILLINGLFVTINRIFRIRRERPLVQRVLLYWALVTAGPLFVAGSLSFTGKIAALTLEGVDAGFSRFFYTVGVIALQTLCFAAIYKFVPYCVVRFRDALFGGLVVSVVGLVVKRVFAYYVSVGTFSNIYGAFAALPVFVLWIYVAWYLFFAGAAITAVIPQLFCRRCVDHTKPGNDFFTALAFLKIFADLEKDNQTPICTLTQLTRLTDTPQQDARRVLDGLSAINYVKALSGIEKKERWVFVADARKATLLPVFRAFVLDDSNGFVSDAAGSASLWTEKLKHTEALTATLDTVFSWKQE